MGLDIILGADALHAPLTGIGRYSYELASQLRQHPDVGRLRYFSHGHWVADPLAALGGQSPSPTAPAPGAQSTPSTAPTLFTRLRSTLSANRAAVRVYQSLMPAISRWRVRGEGQAIFHSPNYLVPPFPGRTVNTVHDLSHVFYPEFHPQARVEFMNMAFGSSLRHTEHVITDTETVRQEFIQHFGWSADKVTAIGLGMDAAYHPRSEAELAPVLAKHGLQPRSYALYVGTIEPRKNIGRLLQAYAQLDPALRKACPLVLAGGKGWKSEDVHRRMEQAANEGWLHYLSYVDQADLPMLYAGARLFAYPSLYEGFGLPIVEAMASGTPVLTSDASCMPEVAGGAAALVNPLDVDDILRGLQSHLDDEAWLRDASAKGLARAATYSWQRCAAETLAVYKAL